MKEPWKQDGKAVVVKTPEEWAAEAAGTDPWACPRCGCRDSRVIDSRFNGAERVRLRVCRHCNTPLPRTREVPVPDGFKLEIVPDADDET